MRKTKDIRKNKQRSNNKKDKLRILVSAENFYPRIGGAEVIIDELMTQLRRAGHKVYAVYVGKKKENSSIVLMPVSKSFMLKNAPLLNRTVVRQYYANFRWRKLIAKKIKMIKPDIIFTQLEYSPSTIDVAKRYNIPSVVYIHNYDHFCPALFKHMPPEKCNRICFACYPLVYKLQHPVSMKYIKWQERALHEADLILSNSKYMARLLKRFYGLESKVFYPVLHLDDFKIPKRDRKPEYITFINPIKTKGAEVVLEIVKTLPNRKFLVVGGKDKSYIERFKQLLNVKYVSWTDDMRGVYSKTKVLLVPSLWTEPFGRVIPEAQINGILCITSDKGGLPEAVGKGGILIRNAQDVNEWVAAIKRLDDKGEFNKISKLAEMQASKLIFKKQWQRFNSILAGLLKSNK